jgi:antirestriction protein ArdC
MKPTSSTKLTVADVIAQRFITALENGTAPWHKPWKALSAYNGESRKAYRGVNRFTIAFFGTDNAYLTFNQVKARGGKITEGTKGLPIQFWSKVDAKKSKNGKEFMFARFYTVFPVNACNLPDFVRADKQIDFIPVEKAEALVKGATLCPITFGGDSAHFTPSKNTIGMPHQNTFASADKFYATLFHEIGHSLMSAEQRAKGTQSMSNAYGKEELVAELFASLCLNECGLLTETTFEHNASYLACWIKNLKADPSLISTASTEAFRRFEAFLGVKANEPVEAEAQA